MSYHDQPCQCVQCRLWRQWERLEPQAKEVLVILAERLARGNEKYGDLDVTADGRNWWTEFGEEMADGAVYAACKLLALAMKERQK